MKVEIKRTPAKQRDFRFQAICTEKLDSKVTDPILSDRPNYTFFEFGKELYSNCILSHSLEFFVADTLLCIENKDNSQNSKRIMSYFNYDGISDQKVPNYDLFSQFSSNDIFLLKNAGNFDEIINIFSRSRIGNSTIRGFNNGRRIELISQENYKALNNEYAIDENKVANIIHFFYLGLSDFNEKGFNDFENDVNLDRTRLENDTDYALECDYTRIAYDAGFYEGLRQFAFNFGYSGFSIDDIPHEYTNNPKFREIITEAFNRGKGIAEMEERKLKRKNGK